jgi:hypothetical protein
MSQCLLTTIKKLTVAQNIATNQMKCRELEKNMQNTSTLAGQLNISSNYPLLIEKLHANEKEMKQLLDKTIAINWLFVNYVNDLKCNKKICQKKLTCFQILICRNIVKANIALIKF